MCDTFIIPGSATDSGHPVFAKNSDREPNEAQHLVYVPRASRSNRRVKTSFIEVDHVADTFGMWLSKPFQLWGAEMGVNEHRVAIGNEAVFTRVPIKRKNDGLTGMDMIRLALERCRTAREALEQICYYVEAYGQDACGGYLNRSFYYHNSFIIADPGASYVLETAGKHWVYRKLQGFYAISNRLTIGGEWDGISASAIAYARQKNWVKRGADFDFAAAYTAPVMSWLSKAKERRHTCETASSVLSARGKITVADAMGMLRTHRHGEAYLPHKGGMDSVCLHATGLLAPSQTNGSMVAELIPGSHEPVWATGSAAPCLSLFKPFFLDTPCDEEQFIKAPGARADNAYWWQWEAWHREALQNYPAARSIWANLARPLEQVWLQQAEQRAKTGNEPREHARISREAVAASLHVLREMREALRTSGWKKTGWLYRHYWNTWNRKAGLPASFR